MFGKGKAMISMVSIFLVLMLTIGGSPVNPTNPAYNNGSAIVVHPESTAGRINKNAKPRLGPKKIFSGIRGKTNPENAGTIYKNKSRKSNSHRESCYGYNKTHMKTYEQRGHNNNAGDVYTYDDVYRLTNVKINVPDPTVPNPTEFEKEKTFNFDKLDNILSIVETQNEQTVTKTTQINSVLNQYENFDGWGLSYDLNGNTTQKGTQHFTYNYRNQIIKAKDQTTEANYKYDALGRRIQKAVTVGSTTKTTNYYYSGMHVIEERDGSDNVLNQYIYGNGIDEILRMDKYTGTSSTPYYFHTNEIGSVTAITDENGDVIERVSYDTFGMPTFTDAAGEVVSKSTIGNTLLFHGRRYDAETNLFYYRARYYDPIMGRFLQTDPMGYYDSMNLYQGFNMNPVNFIDPWGLLTNDQRRMVRVQVLRLLIASSDSAKTSAFETLRSYRSQFGALTDEDIIEVFGENDYILASTDLNLQTLLNYAGAKIALGIDDLSTGYEPSYSSRYGDMHARNEIDPQYGAIDLYNAVVNSRSRIRRISKGKMEGLWENVKLNEENYESVLAEAIRKEQQGRIVTIAITSFTSHWAWRTGLRRSIPKIEKNLPLKDPRLKSQIEKVIKSFDKTGKPPEGVWQGGRRGQPRGLFMNERGKLPIKPRGYYTETDIWPGSPGSRGAERLIIGRGGEVYYTPDHYNTFVQIR